MGTMASHIFMNSRVANMFIELVLITSVLSTELNGTEQLVDITWFLGRDQKVLTSTTPQDPQMRVGSDQKLFINNISMEGTVRRETPATVWGRETTNCP